MFLHNFAQQNYFLVTFRLIRRMRHLLPDIKPVGVVLNVRLNVVSLSATWDFLNLPLQFGHLIHEIKNLFLLSVQLMLLHALGQFFVDSSQCVLVGVVLSSFLLVLTFVWLLVLQLGFH